MFPVIRLLIEAHGDITITTDQLLLLQTAVKFPVDTN